MTTIRRKQTHLVEKIQRLKSKSLLEIRIAPKGAGKAGSTWHDPEAVYVSRKTLLALLSDYAGAMVEIKMPYFTSLEANHTEQDCHHVPTKAGTCKKCGCFLK